MNFLYEDTLVEPGGYITATMCQYGSNSIAYCCSCYTLNTGSDTNCSFTNTVYTNV